MKRKIEITLETAETIVVRTRETTKLYCPFCQKMADMVSPYALAKISGGSEREIFRLIEDGAVHFIEGDRLLICLNSLNSIKGELTQ